MRNSMALADQDSPAWEAVDASGARALARFMAGFFAAGAAGAIGAVEGGDR